MRKVYVAVNEQGKLVHVVISGDVKAWVEIKGIKVTGEKGRAFIY